jgi:hypothetical protein
MAISIKSVLSVFTFWFQNVCQFLFEQIKHNILLASMKLLTSSENIFGSTLQRFKEAILAMKTSSVILHSVRDGQ